MNLRLLTLYLTVIILSIGCKPQQASSKNDSVVLSAKKDRGVYRKSVSFELFNHSENPVLVASTYHLFIERYNSEYNSWERLPYRPCKCSSPCPSPSIVQLDSKSSISIVWERYQVSCNKEVLDDSYKTEEIFHEKGLYRMKFRYTPIVDGKKTNSMILVKEFKLR